MADITINGLPLLTPISTDRFEIQRAGVDGESGSYTLQDIIDAVPPSTTAVWGQITGDIAQQSDLQAALSTKLSTGGGNLTGPLDIEAPYNCLSWHNNGGDTGYLASTTNLIVIANTVASDSEFITLNSAAEQVQLGVAGAAGITLVPTGVRITSLVGAGTRDVQVLADGTLVAV